MGCGSSSPAAVETIDSKVAKSAAATNGNGVNSVEVPAKSAPPAPASTPNVAADSKHKDLQLAPTALPPRTAPSLSASQHKNNLDASLHRSRHGHSSNSLKDKKGMLTSKPSAVGLDQMIENRREEGNLTNNVVHIEVPFGKPIEEVYDGVHDGKVLGSGISGIVRLCTHKESGVKYAVKCLDLGLIDSVEQLTQLREEIFIMCQLDHPNIVRLEEVYESHSEIYLVQELCLGGELFDRLDEQPDYHYSEHECARLVKQILCSVRYIHSKGIVHRDLKLENFLFTSKSPDSELKMIDFGLSKHFFQGEVQSEAVGTPYTVAPEVIRGRYDERCDVWAVGVIAFLLLSGDPPFGGCGGPEPLVQVRDNILRGKFEFEPHYIWSNVSNTAKDFIRKLLITNPMQRPNAWEAQQHDWITVYSKAMENENDKMLDRGVMQSLVQFKELSDMRKLLCEVLSFTLLPEQIAHLRKAFEQFDTEGSGEISLEGLKQVLMANASDGSLGALTEDEVQDIFDAMRVRKTETTIHWHEFIAAGLSQCEVDDRNLRLAFNRLDREHKGYITFENVLDLVGADAEEEEQIRHMYQDSLHKSRIIGGKITYEDFLLLMKGQTKGGTNADGVVIPCSPLSRALAATATTTLHSLPDFDLGRLDEGDECNTSTSSPTPRIRKLDQNFEEGELSDELNEGEQANNLNHFDNTDGEINSAFRNSYTRVEVPPINKRDRLRSKSYDEADTMYPPPSPRISPRSPKRNGVDDYENSPSSPKKQVEIKSYKSNLTNNRELYRAHRKLRLAVLEASKRFEEQTTARILKEMDQKSVEPAAGLTMRRGIAKELSSNTVRKILDMREAEHRKHREQASNRGGRRGRRQKVVSDLSTMMSSPSTPADPAAPSRMDFGGRQRSAKLAGTKDLPAPPNFIAELNGDNDKQGDSGMLSSASSEGNLPSLL
eukprot:CAMPEP_0116048316 /NCGR_PEP_ID=MMETSP0321-20121206/29478_1 /TAXON_ID=163516 /ORGANISM="Leptocylindrus danicus var. danicus, Strain B650" /LENGTH=942 /DNA_ID=CAMNT_0003530491 /DNA_START=66 /DNA_END=2894 /DNA_ORIENTATION=+